MDENIRGIRIARNKAVAFATVEPLHRGFEGRPFRLGNIARLANRIGRGSGRAVVEFQYSDSLEPLRPLNGIAHHASPLLCQLETGLAHTGLLEKDVPLHGVRRFDEAVALDRVKPLDAARNLYNHLTGFR